MARIGARARQICATAGETTAIVTATAARPWTSPPIAEFLMRAAAVQMICPSSPLHTGSGLRPKTPGDHPYTSGALTVQATDHDSAGPKRAVTPRAST